MGREEVVKGEEEGSGRSIESEEGEKIGRGESGGEGLMERRGR